MFHTVRTLRAECMCLSFLGLWYSAFERGVSRVKYPWADVYNLFSGWVQLPNLQYSVRKGNISNLVR